MFIKFIYLLLLFYGLRFVRSQDIEVEGVLRFGDSFLNQLKNNVIINQKSQDDTSSLEVNNLSKSRKNTEFEVKIDRDKQDMIESNNGKIIKAEAKHLNVDSLKVNSKNTTFENIIKEADRFNVSETSNKYVDASQQNIKRVKRFINNANANTKLSEKHGYPQKFNKYLIIYEDKNNKSNHTSPSNSKDFFDVQQELIQINSGDNKNNENPTKSLINEHTNENFTIQSNNEPDYYPPVNVLLMKDNPRAIRFLEYIIYDEVENIVRIAERLQQKIGLERSVFLQLLKTASGNYTMKIKRYVAFIYSQETNTDIDREYQFLDIVASSIMLLYSEESNLLKTMVDKKDNVTEYDLKTLTEGINQENVNQKKRQMFFLCDKLLICKAYPGFYDYTAELLGEMLKLSDNQLDTIVKITTELIKKRSHFFKSFMKDHVADMIGEKLEMLSLDLDNLKEMFSIVRSIITQRFKLMKTPDHKLMIKTKAVRILIDIIDKTFSLAADDLTVITFDTAVKAVRQWALGERNKIDIPLKLLVEHIVGVLRFNWDNYVRSEVAMLTEVMITGETNLMEIFNELFSRGSRFVRNEFVNSD